MTLPTCAVTTTVYKQDGSVDFAARLRAKLHHVDIEPSFGYVLPFELDLAADPITGLITWPAWPNARGSTSSYYKVAVEGSEKTEHLLAVVPDVPSTTLEACATLPVFAGYTEGQLAIEEATAAAGTAHDDMLLTLGYRNTANAAAATATTQAGIATTQAGLSDTARAAAQAARAAIDNHIYPGGYVADPLTRPDGTACQAGDECYRTDLEARMVFRASAWSNYEVAAAASAAASAANAAAALASQTAAATSEGNAAAFAATTTAYAAGRTVATWAALSAISGLPTGTRGEVTTDPAATHTDPVTATTVANEGLYSYVSPTGWRWLAARDVAALTTAADALADSVKATTTDGLYYEWIADNEAFLGLNPDTGKAFGSVIDNLGIRPYEAFREWPLRLAATPIVYTDGSGWNHILGNGQSNFVGSADGAAPFSTTQPYSNLTFNGGVRADGSGSFPWTATKPLIEELPAGSSSSETPCSGAAEMANNYAARKHGILPANLVWFASVSAIGATALANLDKPSATYTKLIAHVTQAKALAVAAGKNYNCSLVAIIEGETDSGATSRATYSGLLNTYISDFNVDIKAAKGNNDPVHLLIAQPSYGAALAVANNMALAHADVFDTNPLAHMSHPTYFLPFDQDDTHRTVAGHKLEGAYFGRAGAQILLEQRKPDYLKVLGGSAYGTAFRIRFRVPAYPLKLDISTLQKVTDFGIKIIDDTGTLTLSNIRVDPSGDAITGTLNRALGTNPRLRVGIDYLAWNLNANASGITNGAMTNIRDSTADTIVIDGVTYPMYHWCQHYEGAISNLVS